MKSHFQKRSIDSLCCTAFLSLASLAVMSGCEAKEEKLLEIQTPNTKLEINKTSDGSKVEFKKKTSQKETGTDSSAP